MPRIRALSVGVAIAAGAAIAVSPAVATAQTSSVDPQTSSQLRASSGSPELITRSFAHSGFYREYTLALPADYDGDPLLSGRVVGFGGLGDTAAGYRSHAGLERAAAGEAIIIYAQGVNNAWAGAPYATTTLAQDIEYARSVITDGSAISPGTPTGLARWRGADAEYCLPSST